MDSATFLRLAPSNEPAASPQVLKSSPTAGPALQTQEANRRRSYSGSHATPPKIRRRNRLITSCLECRRRKLKCDKGHPCGNCTKFVRDCVFLAPALDPAAQMKLAEIKEKMGTLERTLEEDVARRALGENSQNAAGLTTSNISSEGEGTGPEDEKDLEPTPLAFEDAAYYEDADDDLMDLGVQIGKMRLTERLGGLVRPELAFELTHVMPEREMRIKSELKDYENLASGMNQTSNIENNRQNLGPELLAPGKDFTVPSSSFFFAEEPKRSSIIQYLPTKQVADRLLEQYWDAVHYMARIVHRPTFERQWVQFWECVHVGVEPPASLQALVMATLLSAMISLSEDAVAYEFGGVKSQLLDSFRQGTESALYKANFLRTTKLQTLQALVMYLVSLCRREVSRAHSALTGAAIRLAECMGLHRDGTHYGLSPVDVHVRRIIWHQLCFLDIRTCEATGPRPQIHKEDYDTRLPLNVNDVELEGPNQPVEHLDRWTDMTFSLMRFECLEMHRYIWRERPRLEDKSATLTQVLSKVQGFVHESEKKFLPMLDKTIPIQYMTLLVYRLMTLRMYVMVLHRYATTPLQPMPERLRKILLSSSVQQVECAIIIETTPSLAKWAWNLGAFHQYHTAILLLSELYATPERYFEDRIWDCLDWVFELPSHLTRREKARLVFNEIVSKTQYYHSLRRVRKPKPLEDGLKAYIASSPAPSSITEFPRKTLNRERPSYTDPIPSMEFKNFTFLPEVQYYAAAAGRPSQSPQSSDQGSVEAQKAKIPMNPCAASNARNPMQVDIDWNEWDKLFPADVNITDISPPDFHAANNGYREFTNPNAYSRPPQQRPPHM